MVPRPVLDGPLPKLLRSKSGTVLCIIAVLFSQDFHRQLNIKLEFRAPSLWTHLERQQMSTATYEQDDPLQDI